MRFCRRFSTWAWGTTDYSVGMHIVKSLKPAKIKEFEGKEIIGFGAGVSHSVCLSKSNEIFVWGSNYFGQSGYFPDLAGGIFESGDDTLDCPKLLQEGFSPADKLVQISVGDFHSLALTEKGFVYAWGAAILGNGSKLYNSEPELVSGLKNVSSIKVYGNTSSTLCENQICAWGRFGFIHPDGQAMKPVGFEIGNWESVIDYAVTKTFIAIGGRSNGKTVLKIFSGKSGLTEPKIIPNFYPYNPEYLEAPKLISEPKIELASLTIVMDLNCPGLVQLNPVGNQHILLLFGNFNF